MIEPDNPVNRDLWLAALPPQPMPPCPCYAHGGRCCCDSGRILPGKGPHVARLACARCGRFVRWIGRAELAAIVYRHAFEEQLRQEAAR